MNIVHGFPRLRKPIADFLEIYRFRVDCQDFLPTRNLTENEKCWLTAVVLEKKKIYDSYGYVHGFTNFVIAVFLSLMTND